MCVVRMCVVLTPSSPFVQDEFQKVLNKLRFEFNGVPVPKPVGRPRSPKNDTTTKVVGMPGGLTVTVKKRSHSEVVTSPRSPRGTVMPNGRPIGSPGRRPYTKDCPACNGAHKKHICPDIPMMKKGKDGKDLGKAMGKEKVEKGSENEKEKAAVKVAPKAVKSVVVASSESPGLSAMASPGGSTAPRLTRSRSSSPVPPSNPRRSMSPANKVRTSPRTSPRTTPEKENESPGNKRARVAKL